MGEEDTDSYMSQFGAVILTPHAQVTKFDAVQLQLIVRSPVFQRDMSNNREQRSPL